MAEMKVTIEQMMSKDLVGGLVPQNVYQVFVEHDALVKYTPSCKVCIGYLGTQDGANFCELPSFKEILGPPNRDAVVVEAKRLHGNASKEKHMELPPPIEIAKAPE